MVAFAGTGEVARSWSDFSRDAFVPGYGAGVRYMLSEAYRIYVGIEPRPRPGLRGLVLRGRRGVLTAALVTS